MIFTFSIIQVAEHINYFYSANKNGFNFIVNK